MGLRRQFFSLAVVDYHLVSMWCAAFALLWTGGTRPAWDVVTKEFDQALPGCKNCSWFRAAYAGTLLSACAWLLNFVVMAHYYRKSKKAG